MQWLKDFIAPQRGPKFGMCARCVHFGGAAGLNIREEFCKACIRSHAILFFKFIKIVDI